MRRPSPGLGPVRYAYAPPSVEKLLGALPGGGRVLPTAGPARDRRSWLSGPGGRSGDPRAGDRGAGRQPPDQPPAAATLSWAFDQEALDTEQATDGWYGLLTNLTVDQADAAEVLERYKGQEVVERRYGTFKGPLGSGPCS